mgnify:CR=1 FL=1
MKTIRELRQELGWTQREAELFQPFASRGFTPGPEIRNRNIKHARHAFFRHPGGALRRVFDPGAR